MSGSGATRDPLDAGMPGGSGSDIPPGSAQVHSRITQDNDVGSTTRSAYDRPLGSETAGGTGVSGGAGGAAGEGDQSLAERGMERAHELADQASERAHELGDRAGEMASRAQERAAEALDQAEHTIEERTGLISTIRENPLPALGIAFGLGFLLAGSEGGKRGRQGSSSTVQQAKSAIMGAISAAAAQQARSLLGNLAGASGGGESGRPRTGEGSAGRGPARH